MYNENRRNLVIFKVIYVKKINLLKNVSIDLFQKGDDSIWKDLLYNVKSYEVQ